VKAYPQHRLVHRWRDKIADARVPYLKRYGAERPAVGEPDKTPLKGVKQLDEGLHRRLLMAILVFDMGCAHQDADEINAAGKALVEAWHAVTTAMSKEAKAA
jgi:hypothetical protein